MEDKESIQVGTTIDANDRKAVLACRDWSDDKFLEWVEEHKDAIEARILLFLYDWLDDWAEHDNRVEAEQDNQEEAE